MEFSISGNALKTFARSMICLARVGDELVVQASPTQLGLHTLNASRSAYQCITFQSSFFDAYAVSGPQAHFSVLLKAVCSVLETPVEGPDHMSVQLPDHDASKVKWVLECYSGIKKTHWISCNVEPDIQHLSLDRGRFPSSLVVHPRSLSNLLGNFQSPLQEITIIATDQTSFPSDAESEIGGKAVEFRSYVDSTKDGDSLLHTQLRIDPSEEFLQYTHAGDPVNITFSLRELKAFLSFCEGCEADIHLFFGKAGEPILMAPKFGLGDVSSSSFDASLVLATMFVSQLQEGVPQEHPEPENSAGGRAAEQTYLGLLGGRPKRRNQQSQAKEHAQTLKKNEAESSSSQVTKEEPTYREMFYNILKDWNSVIGQIIGFVMDQGERDICWAVCFARLLQALHNMEHPNDQVTFSYEELIGQIKPANKDTLALANLKKAFNHISMKGMLKTPTKGHGMAGDKGKRVQATFDLFEGVDASFIRQKLDMYPVALRLEITMKLSSNLGEVYYLPKKIVLTANTRLHCMLLIGYGMTKEGELYFIGQNSWGKRWGCEGYTQIIIEGACDIICHKD